MKYAYYPGCSLTVSNKAYDVSVRAVAKALDHPLEELTDWNCCGATTFMSVRELYAFAVSARNLALAEARQVTDLLVACSACYTTLNKANIYMSEDADLRKRITGALGAAGLRYDGSVRVRHVLDFLVNDVGREAIESKVVNSLSGLKVAAYYGCQMTRPFDTFDDAEFPVTMDNLLSWTGAEPVNYPLKTRCCGAMLMTTSGKVALDLVHSLLKCAVDNGANVIVTACPLCQFNLEAYQDQVNRTYGTNISIPIAYFTQVLGVAMGIPLQGLELGKELVPTVKAFASYTGGSR
jgi:heterodisulfide reductase subunit B2